MQRSSVRIRADDLEKIRSLASAMNVSQEKCISRILDLTYLEKESGKLKLLDLPATEQGTSKDLREIKKILHRIFKELCVLSEDDANDPDLGLTLTEYYDDKNKHPEKYGEQEKKENEVKKND